MTAASTDISLIPLRLSDLDNDLAKRTAVEVIKCRMQIGHLIAGIDRRC